MELTTELGRGEQAEAFRMVTVWEHWYPDLVGFLKLDFTEPIQSSQGFVL